VDRTVPCRRGYTLVRPLDKTLILPFHCTHEPCPCVCFYYQIHERRRRSRLYVPMLIPPAPSARAATSPRLSAIPPEAIYGTFRSCAARASCMISVDEPPVIGHKQRTNTNPGISSSPGCPAPITNDHEMVSKDTMPKYNTHSNPSMLRMSTPSFSADYVYTSASA